MINEAMKAANKINVRRCIFTNKAAGKASTYLGSAALIFISVKFLVNGVVDLFVPENAKDVIKTFKK